MKIYTKKICRKYKRGQPPYAYPKHLVPISSCYNELIVDFLEKPLDEKVWITNETMYIALTRKANDVTQNG